MGRLLILGWLMLAACDRTPDAYEQVLAEMGAIEQQMCACADLACRQEASAELGALRTSLGRRLAEQPKPTAAQERRGRAIEDAIRACRGAGRIPTGAATGPDDGPRSGAAESPIE